MRLTSFGVRFGVTKVTFEMLHIACLTQKRPVPGPVGMLELLYCEHLAGITKIPKAKTVLRKTKQHFEVRKATWRNQSNEIESDSIL